MNFKISYKNTGTTEQDTVVAKDVLPDGLSFLPNTTWTATTRNSTKMLASDALFGEGGLGLGAMIAGEEATVEYKAKVLDDTNLFPCGDTTIMNNATLYTHDGSETATAKIIVRRTCDTVPTSSTPSSSTPSVLPKTGPGEIVMAVVIVLVICGGGFYFYRSQKMLKKVSNGGGSTENSGEQTSSDIVRDGIMRNKPEDKKE